LPEYSQPTSEEDILDSIVQQEDSDTLWQLVRELPKVEQRILVMRHAEHLSYAQIANSLKRTEKSCKKLHYQALKKLKKKVHEAGL
jgi:RNA polymerase sigma factor (sigma-70 family)